MQTEGFLDVETCPLGESEAGRAGTGYIKLLPNRKL